MSNIAPFQAKYLAHELTRRYSSNSYERFSESLNNAQVDLNPHQVEAAYFAFKNPLSHGAILADEVGLGKTIEAGILLSQKWAERRRNLLIIVPSNLRKQWSQELQEKFFLPSVIMENASLKAELRKKNFNPFEQKNNLVVCSYHFARKHSHYIEAVKWDLVVIDEAHRLRNVYKPNNKIANEIRLSLQPFQKVLLTATPLQNSLMELFGLVSIVDEYTFGDLKSFKEQYGRFDPNTGNYSDLKSRIIPVVHRTLRRQVQEYVKYTSRRAIVQEFYPSEKEQQLHGRVTEFLRRERLYSLPQSQRQLLTLMLLKLQASSTHAITPTFKRLIEKLEMLKKVLNEAEEDLGLLFGENSEYYEAVKEEWLDDEEDTEEEEGINKKNVPITKEDIPGIEAEIEELQGMFQLAESIEKNGKAENLVAALQKGLSLTTSIGANKKAIIFTESTRTQRFLQQLLEQTEFRGQTVLFNGTNSDPQSNDIYKAWQERHQGTDMVSGSKTADKRAAIVEYFRNQASIMIATEAAAEGINLQFCSLILNYDLPWNPQRIEQRIGRCHRYGQKHDVVVVNFLNKKNTADERVYQLLAQKFKLFEGVFGSSDEVLGSIESGVELEKRIVEIYRSCRTSQEIQRAFDELQHDLEPQIEDKMQQARQTLLENFDEEVHQKLRINLDKSKEYLDRFERRLWALTKFGLKDFASFNDQEHSFTLNQNPFVDAIVPTGKYRMAKNVEDAHTYRAGHALAQKLIEQAKQANVPEQVVTFNLTDHRPKISALETYSGQSGYLKLMCVTLNSLESEDYLVAGCVTRDGAIIPDDVALKMMELQVKSTSAIGSNGFPQALIDNLNTALDSQAQKLAEEGGSRNGQYFKVELDKIEKWADDLMLTAEQAIRDTKKRIRELNRESRKTTDAKELLKIQQQLQELNKKQKKQRKDIFDMEDEIEQKREKLIAEIEERMKQNVTTNTLFTLHWALE